MSKLFDEIDDELFGNKEILRAPKDGASVFEQIDDVLTAPADAERSHADLMVDDMLYGDPTQVSLGAIPHRPKNSVDAMLETMGRSDQEQPEQGDPREDVLNDVAMNRPELYKGIKAGLDDGLRPEAALNVAEYDAQSKNKDDRNFFQNVNESFKRGIESAEIDQLSYDAATGSKNYDDVKKIKDEYEQRITADPVEADNWLSKTVHATAGMLPPLLEGTKEGWKGALTAAAAAFAAGQAGPQIATPEEVITVPVAAGAASTVGSSMYWYRQGTGAMYSAMRDQGNSHETASIVSQFAGIPYAALEYSQVSKIIPGVSKMELRRIMGKTAIKAAMRLAAKFGLDVGTEVAEEVGQEGVIIIAEEVGNALEQNGDISKEDVVRIKDRLVSTGKESFGPMALLLLPQALIGGHGQVRDVTKLRKNIGDIATGTGFEKKEADLIVDQAMTRIEKGDDVQVSVIESIQAEFDKRPKPDEPDLSYQEAAEKQGRIFSRDGQDVTERVNAIQTLLDDQSYQRESPEAYEQLKEEYARMEQEGLDRETGEQLVADFVEGEIEQGKAEKSAADEINSLIEQTITEDAYDPAGKAIFEFLEDESENIYSKYGVDVTDRALAIKELLEKEDFRREMPSEYELLKRKYNALEGEAGKKLPGDRETGGRQTADVKRETEKKEDEKQIERNKAANAYLDELNRDKNKTMEVSFPTDLAKRIEKDTGVKVYADEKQGIISLKPITERSEKEPVKPKVLEKPAKTDGSESSEVDVGDTFKDKKTGRIVIVKSVKGYVQTGDSNKIQVRPDVVSPYERGYEDYWIDLSELELIESYADRHYRGLIETIKSKTEGVKTDKTGLAKIQLESAQKSLADHLKKYPHLQEKPKKELKKPGQSDISSKADPVESVTVTINADKGGIELRFKEKPTSFVIADMKEKKFRYSSKQKMWYKRTSLREDLDFAEGLVKRLNAGSETADDRPIAEKHAGRRGKTLQRETKEKKLVKPGIPNTKYAIYPIQTTAGDRFAVRENMENPRGGGDPLFDSESDAIRYIETEKKREAANAEAVKRQELADEAEKSKEAERKKVADERRGKSNVIVDDDKISNSSPLVRGRINKLLDKQINIDGRKIYTYREFIESGKLVRKESVEVPRIKYNRRKYNRMGAAEQEEYDRKLKEKKTEYRLYTAEDAFYDIPKMLYDVINVRDVAEKAETSTTSEKETPVEGLETRDDIPLSQSPKTGTPSAPSEKGEIKDKKPGETAAGFGEKNTVFTKEAHEDVMRQLRDKLNNVQSGIDPDTMTLTTRAIGYYVESGVRKFADVAMTMLKELGPAVKKYLKGAYLNVSMQEDIDTSGMDSQDAIRNIDLDTLENETNQPESTLNSVEEAEEISNEIQRDRGELSPGEKSKTSQAATQSGDSGGVSGQSGERGAGERDSDSTSDRQPEPAKRLSGKTKRGAGSRKPGKGDRAQSDAGSYPATDYKITTQDRLGEGGLKAKARDNLEAIRTLKQIEAENRHATPEEQQILVKYVGFGGLINMFPDRGKVKSGWQAEVDELRELLTDEEYDAARASTPNAHYTSETVINSIWDIVRKLGFESGRVLEPGMGVGHFYGLMPSEMRSNSQLHGIELDAITGRIAQQLYPSADISVTGYQNKTLPNDFFDVVVGNVPFADVKPYDPTHNKERFSLHDYYFNKSLNLTKPGGLVVFITSRYTMDKQSDRVRTALAKKADFVGAIRLPNTAFKQNANTEVTTDIIILRKRKEGAASIFPAFTSVETVQLRNKDNEKIDASINEYFVGNPKMVAGRLAATGTMYGGNEPTVEPTGDLATQLKQIVLHELPEKIRFDVEKQDSPADRDEDDTNYNNRGVKEGAYYVDGDELYQVVDGVGKVVKKKLGNKGKDGLSKLDHGRVKGLSKIRDAIRKALKAQMDGLTDAEKDAARKELHDVYDAFVDEFGIVNDTKVTEINRKDGKTIFQRRTKNLKPFLDDPDAYLVAAIEDYDDVKNTAGKGAIFHEDVLRPERSVEDVETVHDALLASLSMRNKVDIPYIAELYKKSEQDVIEELRGKIYNDPESGQWITDDAYLSGNVKHKLQVAEKAAKEKPEFEANVKALEEIQPEDIPPSGIVARLGANWIKADYYKDFLRSLLGDVNINISYIEREARWVIDGWTRDLAATAEWGTDDYDAVSLFAKGMNSQTPEVRRRNSDGTTYKDVTATLNAQDKLQKIKDRFVEWIWEDSARADALGRTYNDKFNNIVTRKLDGSHLTFPGMKAIVPNGWFQGLRPHQKNGAWRVMQQGNTLLGHVVGSGKTITMVAAGMEMKRVGLINKPMYVVPNHMLKQFSTELLDLYPNAKILVADERQFHSSKRKQFVNKVATNNWDAVIITHSAFGKIPISEQREAASIENEILEYNALIVDAKADGDRNIIKNLEKSKQRLKERLLTLSNRKSKDAGVTFEETGIDFMFVDEAHEFKNLEVKTKMGNVKNLPTTGSQKAWDLYTKIGYLNEINARRAVVFATGTPVSNSMVEMYTMQRYLSPELLSEQGIEHFDAWAANYGDKVTTAEIDPTGGSYRMDTRFAKFTNVPELIATFHEVADIQLAEDLNLPTPKLKTGEAQVIEAKASDVQKHFVTSLKNRLDEIKGKKVEKGGDNALKIVGEGRHAALDMRTLDPDARDHPGSKVNLCVDRLIDIHRKTAKERLTQMVFCDLNTPGKGGFSVYDDIKTKLIKSGIPASEIAFIHDANTAVKKERLFADVRAGKVRVLIGSTAKMGVGTNVQKRLVAMHHLDAPWRPSDIEQRDGRILRQGNENEEVEIFRYVTSGTFDAYMWQTLEVKQKFISQIMKGDRSIREMDDLDEGGALNAAQVKAIATGNPMILEAVGLESDINRLKRLRNAHKDEQFRFKRGVRQANDDIMWADENITEYEELIKIRDANTGEKFSIIVDGKVYDKRKDAGKQIISQISQALEKKEWNKKRTVGEFRGAAIVIEAEKLGKTLSVANVTLKIKNNEYSLREVFDEKSDAVGLIRQIDNRLNSFESRLESEKERREDANKSIPGLEARIGKPFAKEDELAEKEVRHADIVAQLSDTAETTDDVQEQRGSALARADGKWNAEAVEILSKAVEGVSVRYVADGEIQQGESKKGQPQGQPVLGYYDSANNEIVINRDRATKDTIFHEFAHPVINYVRENDKKLYEQGMSLIRGSEYANSEEGLVQAIGEKGAKIQDDVKRNKFVAWLKRVWMKAKIAFKKAFGFEMSLDEFTDMMALSMRSGIPLTPFTKGGRKTLVKPQGQKQTGTAAFRKWFGKSKVVDEKGEPLVVYHGTNRDFNIFGDGNNNNVERGVHYFTENSKISGEYAITAKPHAEQNIESQIKEVDRKAHAAYENKDWDIHSKYYKQKVRLEAELVYNIRPHNKRGEGANVISVYLSIERPFKINADGNFWQNMNSTIKEAKGKGYDGIYVQNVDDPAHIILAGRPHNVWIAFAPTQIKSATGNRGTFDAENADIQYQFAGKRAKTADETLLQQAETMLKNDFDADTVREQTGWFVNPFDKKWRFEIDDRKLEFKGRKNWVRLFDGNEMQLRDLIDHDALFKAYPELMDTKVMLTAISGDKGGFVNDQGEMGIGSGAVEDIAFHMNTVDASRLILHEVQHLIQRIEGFAQGGSPGQFILEDIAEAEKHARKRMDKINSEIRVLNKGENSLRELQQLTDLNKELNELRDVTADMITMSRSDAHARYTNLAGEYESRDVEARADYDEFQRLGVAPFSSEPQITEDNVIVTYDGGGGASFKLGDEKTPYPDVPSAYEKGKDDWFGEKDWKRRQASNEANKLQKRIQNTIRKKPSRFKEPLRLKWEKEWLDVDRAIHIYIDMKRNPDHLEEFYDDLTDEQKRIVDIAQNLSEDQIAIADDIASSYKETGFEALEEGVIRNVLDNYAARTWDLDGKSTDEYWRKFGTTTRHARRRVLETILEGWANGYELKIEGATNNLATLKAEIANVIEDKKLVKECMKIETDDGEKLFSFKNMSGYRQIEHPNFTWWGYAGTIKSNPEAVLEAENSRDLVITPEGTILRRKAIFAPEKIAKKLNRVLGASKIGHIGWVNFLTKYNAVIKATILQTSLFHHIAFTNSYLFGSAISRPSDLNIFGAYKKGLQAIEDAGPHIELLVRNGLTIGNIQDWEENLLREKTAVGRMLDKMAVTKAIKDKIIMFQEKQARLLFQRYGAGLKAFTALLEYKRLLRTMPELEPNQRAKIVADMTNADFGGLHLQRMGRDQTTQHIFRLFALAPDWTESNIRSMVKAVKAGSKEERHVYQTLWGRVATRGLLLTTAANLLLAMWDGDDDDEKYIDSVKRRYKKAWDKGYLKWLDVDISPIYRAMGGDDDHTAYFSLIGHFKDPVKFLTSPKTAAHHKGSVIYRMIFEAIVMKNWRGSPFTTWDELLGVDDKGRYKSSSRKHGYKKGDPKGGKLKGQLTKSKYLETKTGDFEQIPSYLLHQTRQSSAIQIQNAIGYLTGEIEGFEAIAKSAGLKVNVSKNYPKKEVKPKGKRLVRRKRTMVRRTSP